VISPEVESFTPKRKILEDSSEKYSHSRVEIAHKILGQRW